jgi:hypothetical protein
METLLYISDEELAEIAETLRLGVPWLVLSGVSASTMPSISG